MKNWDAGDWWVFVLCAAAFTMFVVVMTGVCADHRVRRYYVGAVAETVIGPGSCVFADNPWETDDRVFCSTDPQRTLEFMQRANAELKLAAR